MKKAISIIKKFDYYSNTYQLEENFINRNQNLFGAIATISMFLATLVLSFMFGNEIYRRKDPFASTSKQYNTNSIVMLKEMPFVFNFYTKKEPILKNFQDYVDFQVSQMTVHSNNTFILDLSLKLINCSLVKYDKFESIFDNKKNDNKDYFCIGHKNDTLFKNSFTELDSQYISIVVKSCNSKLRKCPDDLNEKLSEFYFQMNFYNSYFDSTNYTDPIQKYEYFNTIQANNKMMKRQYIRFNNNEYITDNGWILEEVVKYNYISLQDIKLDINPLDEKSQAPSLVQLSLESPKIKEVTKRTYLKIQELVAKIGGLVKGFHILLIVISSFYFRFEYIVHIAELSIKKEKSNEYEFYSFEVSKFNNIESINKENLELKSSHAFNSNKKIDLINIDVGTNSNVENKEKNHKIIKEDNKHLSKFSSKNIENLYYKNESYKNKVELEEIITSFSFFDYLRAYICRHKKSKLSYEMVEEYLVQNYNFSKLLKIMSKKPES